MKCVKESGTFFRKKKRAKEAELKKQEGAMLKFVSSSGSHVSGTVPEKYSNENSEQSVELQKDTEEISLSAKTQKTESIQSNTDKINYAAPVAYEDKSENNDEAVAVINNLPNDVASWPEVINHELRVELVKAGPEKYQNEEGPFASSHRTVKVGDSTKLERRSFSENWFYKTLKNGDKILRRWLLYSKKESGLYCFCCKLFHSAGNDLLVTKCFNNFWHLNPRIFEHENSKIYKECIEKWKELAMRLQLQQTIDKNMQKQIDQERKKWKAILKSVVDVILFLSKQNLPFRGHREAFESNNQGNFLETVKLLANIVPYSPNTLLIDTRTSKKMTTTYLSPTIQNELILLLSDKVKTSLLKKSAKLNILRLYATVLRTYPILIKWLL